MLGSQERNDIIALELAERHNGCRRLLPSGGGGVNAATETGCLPPFALSHFDVQKDDPHTSVLLDA
jgi:hypothetical protein